MITQAHGVKSLPRRLDGWVSGADPLTRWLFIVLLMALVALGVSWAHATFQVVTIIYETAK